MQNGLSGKNTTANSELMTKIRETPSKKSVLTEAKDAATQMMELATNGYITIVTNDNGTQELYISDSIDYTEATRLWRWNINGLAYSNDGGRTYGLAMTMDGSIVADYITTGTLNADRIRAGILRGITGNSYWDLETGKLYVDGELFSTGTYADIQIKGGDINFLNKNGTKKAKIEVDSGGQIYFKVNNNDDGFLFGGDRFVVFADRWVELGAQDTNGRGHFIDIQRSGNNNYIWLRTKNGVELKLDNGGDIDIKADNIKIHDADEAGFYTAKENGSVVSNISFSSMDYISKIESTDDGGIRWWSATRDVIGGYNTVGIFKGFIVN
jgi:hypothetical protein